MMFSYEKLSTDVQSRLNVLERYLFGETVAEAIARTKEKDPTNGNAKFDKECAAMQGTTIYRFTFGNKMSYECQRCRRPLILNKDGKFETDTTRVTNTQLIQWGITPVEDLCDHKKKNLTASKVYLDYCGEVQPAGI